MFLIWQKGNKVLGWIYAVIAALVVFGIIANPSNFMNTNGIYALIGAALFAFLSWYCFRPVPKGRWHKLEDGRRVFIEEKH